MLVDRSGTDQRWLRGWTAATAAPLLAALYPIVFLFTLNAAEHVTWDPLWPPIALALGGTALMLAVLAVVTRDPQRAALLTTVAVISFFGYGHAWNAAAEILDNQWPLIGAWLLVTVVALLAVWHAGSWTPRLLRGVALVALIALLLNGANLGSAASALADVDPLAPGTGPEIVLDPPAGGERPDIYYLVPDRYAGAGTLSHHYDFDNEPFLEALEERGFSVADRAHANYTKTPLSLVSALNAEYLDPAPLVDEARSGDDREPIQRRLREPLAVPRALKRIGYQYVHVAGWWGPTSRNVDADRVFTYDGQDSFASALAQTTLVRAFTDPNAAPSDPFDWRVVRGNIDHQLDTLEEVPELDGPKFVYSHVMLPHPPYVFDADGSFMDRPEVNRHGERESYRRQLTYTNGRLLTIVDGIVAETPDAVIVIAADEGPFPDRYRLNEGSFDWRDATVEELEHKFGILFAMRAPGVDLGAAGFHDSLTPVNAFRVLFNGLFAADLAILPDRVQTHVGNRHFYDFVDITERLRR